MKQYAKLTEKILANGMDYVVTWKSKDEGIQAEVELVDSRGRQIKVSVGESFESCMEEIGMYFEN